MRISKPILILIYAVLLTLFWVMIPHKENWTPTYHPKDKLPYGCYILHHALQPNKILSFRNELPDSLFRYAKKENASIVYLTDFFSPSPYEMSNLLSFIEEGGKVIIAASSANEIVHDSLHIVWDVDVTSVVDSVHLQWTTDEGDTLLWHASAPEMPGSYISLAVLDEEADSLGYKLNFVYDTLVVSSQKNDVIAMSASIGKGRLIVHCQPIIFTNMGLINDSKPQVEMLLNRLDGHSFVQDLFFSERALRERGAFDLKGSHFESVNKSPIYEILRHDYLRLAYYSLLVGILLYFLLSIKRRQRAIPVWQPPANESVGFIKLMASLYLYSQDNKKLLEKKIKWLNTFIVYRYGIRDFDWSHKSTAMLSQMSGFNPEKLDRIANIAAKYQEQKTISDGYLKAANQMINEFVYHYIKVE